MLAWAHSTHPNIPLRTSLNFSHVCPRHGSANERQIHGNLLYPTFYTQLSVSCLWIPGSHYGLLNSHEVFCFVGAIPGNAQDLLLAEIGCVCGI